ncbi:hypothetical protein BC332_26531 [Capsicum chinense]|nr:hypothetical protein BC332_26531 [Capsicum chinense]
MLFKFMDEFLEGKGSHCYCSIDDNEASEFSSSSLYKRGNLFRRNNVVRRRKMNENVRWSDCSCVNCVSWMRNAGEELKLHVVVKEPERANAQHFKGKKAENIVFLHGFLSSSSFWIETIFPNLSEDANKKYRLFAVDLLGFGKSPKPNNCLYTIKDHVEMIESSVIHPFELNSIHIVAHSMGCVVALALAAKHSHSVKSITLIAPPYITSTKEDVSLTALNKLAARRLWPPLLFGSSFMSWNLHFMAIDLTRHTHHSAWHTMHNVICGGAKFMDKYLETLTLAKVKINVIQGSKDQVVPVECSNNVKMKVPDAEVKIVDNAHHTSIVIGREKDLCDDLEELWGSQYVRNGNSTS